MRTLRVAFLNHVGNAIGGGERSLATALKHRPADLEAFAILFEDGAYADLLRSLGITVEIVSVSPAFMRTKRESLNLGAALSMPATAFAVRAILRRWQIDVLYTNSMKAHFIGAIAGRLAGVPTVMHFRDIVEGKPLWLLRLFATLGSRRRIACSAEVRKQIGIGATSVVYSPVELDDFSQLPSRENARSALGASHGVPIVSLIGRINRWKGHDRFIRIAARVAAERSVQFWIVGSPVFRDADFLPELQEMVTASKLDDVVRFIPWIDDVREVFAATDINANCSTREPLGRTPAEAAAAGVPSVVFDDSGAAEWIRESGEGRVVPAGDEGRFAAAIVDLLDEGASSHDRAASIRLTAERFDSTRIATELAAVIRAAARKKTQANDPSLS